MRWTYLAGILVLGSATATYVWPSTQDTIDDLLYLQSGYIRVGAISDQVRTCDFGANQPGIQKAAEWIRTAFHDSATHDASAKTGGLDASIQYELDRVENLGAALNDTLADISTSVNIQTSAADLLALALVLAVARCGNLEVPLRLGRKDATEAGIKGVPEAHTDLETTRKRFEIAGFNESEMITLVACGHTVGSVHSVDHPEIVINGNVSAANVAHFDSTFGSYDNKVVTEYLDDSTTNPLIRNTNDTLNSDKRIFAADGNVTMNRLSDPAVYKAQCENLLERMINLVPGDVTLSDPLQPADVRPYITSFEIKNNTMDFTGRVRVRVSPDSGRNASDIAVSLILTDRNGAQNPQEVATRLGMVLGGASSGYFDERFQWYEFDQTLSANSSISSFTVRITTPSSGASTVFDNGGTGGYKINPDITYQRSQSCITFDSATGNANMTLVTAISKQLLASSNASPQLRFVQKTTTQGNRIPHLTEQVLPLVKTDKETDTFVYYQATPAVGPVGSETTFDVEVGESKLLFQPTGDLIGTTCAAF